MSVFFTDTSGLAKRYVTELGSAWVRSWTDPQAGNTIVVSALAVVETVAALARRNREGALPAPAFVRLRNDFLLHVDNEYVVVALEYRTLVNAAELAVRHALRSLDAIQLACALEFSQATSHVPTFVSADRNLLAAAAAEGFPTEDPNAHP